MDKIRITIYMQDGRTYSYFVDDAIKAREHAHRIVNYGWRNIEGTKMCYYPIHQVLKVTFPMPLRDRLATEYASIEPDEK